MPRKKKYVVFADLSPEDQNRLTLQARNDVWPFVYDVVKKEREETAAQMKYWSVKPTLGAVAAAARYRENTRLSFYKDIKEVFRKVFNRREVFDTRSPVRKLGIDRTVEGDIYGLNPPVRLEVPRAR